MSGHADSGRPPRLGAIGRGGISRVAEATGLSRITIRAGLKELDHSPPRHGRRPPGGSRRPGGGRKPLTEHDPKLLACLEALVDPVTRGDPMSPLAVDLQERRPSWPTELQARRASRQRADGQPAAPRPRLQPPVQPQDDRGERSTPTGTPSSSTSTAGSRRSRGGASRWSRWTPRRRNWSGISERRPGVAAQGRARGGEGPRLHRQGAGQGDPLRRLRPDGQRPGGSASGSITTRPSSPSRRCGGGGGRWAVEVYPEAKELLITADGGGRNGSRCRLWKVDIPGVGRRDRAEDLGVPLPAGDQQVEQDRAPDVLPHHRELAGPAAGEP